MATKSQAKPLKSDDIHVTNRHLELVKKELKSDITPLRLETKSGFLKMEARFEAHDAKFLSIDSRFTTFDSKFVSIDARFTAMDSRFDKMESILYGMKALLEEQNARNKIVLDGYAHLFDRSITSDSRIEKLENKVFGISQK